MGQSKPLGLFSLSQRYVSCRIGTADIEFCFCLSTSSPPPPPSQWLLRASKCYIHRLLKHFTISIKNNLVQDKKYERNGDENSQQYATIRETSEWLWKTAFSMVCAGVFCIPTHSSHLPSLSLPLATYYLHSTVLSNRGDLSYLFHLTLPMFFHCLRWESRRNWETQWPLSYLSECSLSDFLPIFVAPFGVRQSERVVLVSRQRGGGKSERKTYS